MATLDEVKAAIDAQSKGTQLLRDQVEKMNGDYVDRATFENIKSMVSDLDQSRKKIETEWLKELEAAKSAADDAKALAEEASLKAGNRNVTEGDDHGVTAEQAEHKELFLSFLRSKGDQITERELKDMETKLGAPGGSGGGVAVPTLLEREIGRKASDESVMRGLVHVVQVGTSDYKKIVNKGGSGYGWVGAGDTRTPTGPFSVYEAEPTMGTIYAYPEFSEENLDDVFFDLAGELIDDVSIQFADGIDVSIVAGDGTKKPTGLLATAPVADADGARADKVFQFVGSGVADTIGTADNLYKLVYTLKRQYRRNASWMLNDMTTLAVRVMKDSQGRYLWQDSLQMGQPDRLAGYAVNAVDAMPDIAANTTPIGFGDWRRAYTLVERHGLRVTRDEITRPGFVKWHIRRRLGGTTTNDDAAKFLKCAA